MNDQVLEFPCPMCGVEGRLRMRTWSEAIPYFGEHTQISLLCEACGWRQTDFIPEDGDEPRAVALQMESEEDLSARVRSPTGMVRLVDLDLEVLESSIERVRHERRGRPCPIRGHRPDGGSISRIGG